MFIANHDFQSPSSGYQIEKTNTQFELARILAAKRQGFNLKNSSLLNWNVLILQNYKRITKEMQIGAQA